MKKFENAKELNELEVAKVAGGVPILHPGHHYDPPPAAPAEPETPEPGPMGRQATFEEDQKEALNLHLNWGM